MKVTNRSPNSWFDGKNFSESKIFHFTTHIVTLMPHCGETRNSLSLKKKKSWNLLFILVIFFCKNVTFTKFLPKKCMYMHVRENFRNFHTVHNTVWSLRNFCITWEFFREINFIVNLFTKEVVFTEFFQKIVICTKIS